MENETGGSGLVGADRIFGRDSSSDLVGADAIFGSGTDVDYELTIEGCDDPLHVVSVSWSERISSLYAGTIEARTDGNPTQRDLLGKNVVLAISRGTEQRSLRGIVRTATVRPADHGQRVVIGVVPAIWLMAQTIDSRIYQDVTVPDLVEQLVGELVGSRNRSVKKDGLTASYPQHEYLVQYRESHLAFLTRLCDEEGIFFYFDHDEEGEDHEVLVLADANDGRPQIRDEHVQLSESSGRGFCVATRIDFREEVGATDAVVSGYDWTNPGMQVRQERTGRGEWGALETHEHFHNVRHFDYEDGGGQYQSHTAQRQADVHAQRLDLARCSWTVDSTVVSAAPGHTFTLEGSEHDDEYLIVGVSAHGDANQQGVGEYRNTLQVIPKSMPYRPPAPARRIMPGPETATVVGEAGEEITTDRHGRVHVQFHWDRRGQRNERSSAWLRVQQQWAGPGYGMIFIPRIGMEVIVSFLGGDPDRPVVTGCLYNGQNPPPYALPEEKTKSTIKTNSSLGGNGFNELRFEDRAGREEVFIHAQKDFNEVVRNDHTTRVGHNQTIRVDVDQKETVGGNQTMCVVGDREKTIEGFETTTVMKDRNEVVNLNEMVTVDLDRRHEVHGSDFLKVDGKHGVTVLGDEVVDITGAQSVFVGAGRSTKILADDALTTSGKFTLEAALDIVMSTDATAAIKAAGAVNISGQSITLASATEVVVNAPQGIRNITPAVEENLFMQSWQNCQQLLENIVGKLSFYTMAINIYGMKYDMVGLKVEAYGFKMDEAGFKASKGMVEIGQRAASIHRAAVTMLG